MQDKITNLPYDVMRLMNMLKTHFPHDVLMPVEKGKKFPMFQHHGGMWKWTDFDTFCHKKSSSELKKLDYCIILNEICVVDIDDNDLANDFEIKFPELNSTVVKCKTSRGMHYYFIRSPKADRDGYYDGAGQKIKGIDFKSVCKTQTGGVIMVPPSSGKQWIRMEGPLLNCLKPIDTSVLDAIAIPRHKVIDITLSFENDVQIHLNKCRWLHLMSYFEPFISECDDNINSEIIPVPCDSNVFNELLYILDTGSLESIDPSLTLLKKVVQVADKLGLSFIDKFSNKMLCGIPRSQLDLHDICPIWWEIINAELHNQSNILRLPENIIYEPFHISNELKNEIYLFPQFQQIKKVGENLLRPNPVQYVEQTFPPILMEFLRYFGNHVAIAGGSVVGAVVQDTDPGNDYDVYIIGCDEEEANLILEAASSMFIGKRMIKTENAVTFIVSDSMIAQVILKLFKTPEDVIATFDFAPCKVIAWYEHGGLQIKASPSWMQAVKNKAFPVDMTCWGEASISRVIKYVTKGFDAFVPGARRSALKPFVNYTKSNEYKMGDYSIMALFKISENIIESLKNKNKNTKNKSIKRPNLNNVRIFINKYPYSEYDVFMKLKNTLIYLIKYAIKRGLSYIRKQDKDLEVKWMSHNGTRHISRPARIGLYTSFNLSHPFYNTPLI